MKSVCFLVVLCVAGAVAFGQDKGVSLLNVKRYSSYFLNGGGRLDSKYLRTAPREEVLEIASFEGNDKSIDTPLEIALLSYSAGVVNVRPVEADTILPADNPRLSGLKLGAAVYKELAELRFLAPSDTAAIGRYDGMLKFIQDRASTSSAPITRAEIEAYYRNGIRGLVAEAVDEQFNKVSFRLANSDAHASLSHTAVLTRNPQNGHYILSYGGAYTNNETREITKPTLDALLAEMSSRKTDFDQTGINQVRAQAALIPAVSHAGKMEAEPTILFTEILTGFYTASTLAESERYYKAIQGLYVRYQSMILAGRGNSASPALYALSATLTALSPDLNKRITSDMSKNGD